MRNPLAGVVCGLVGIAACLALASVEIQSIDPLQEEWATVSGVVVRYTGACAVLPAEVDLYQGSTSGAMTVTCDQAVSEVRLKCVGHDVDTAGEGFVYWTTGEINFPVEDIPDRDKVDGPVTFTVGELFIGETEFQFEKQGSSSGYRLQDCYVTHAGVPDPDAMVEVLVRWGYTRADSQGNWSMLIPAGREIETRGVQ